MEKLTLEHVAPYLPYGLKAKGTDDTIYNVLGAYDEMGVGKGKNLMPLYNDQYGRVLIDYTERLGYDFKPILRPMDLTKPIIVEGKEIIPIVELYRLSNEYYDSKELDYEFIDSWGGGKILKVWHNITKEEYTEFIYHNLKFRKDRRHQKGSFVFGMDLPHAIRCESKIYNQYALFQWLFKHKFDVFGLIEKGLAIDVNTLETNPYE